ncbi:MAG: alpha/beta hydrolase-fold protein [Phycisphaerae bacterium]
MRRTSLIAALGCALCLACAPSQQSTPLALLPQHEARSAIVPRGARIGPLVIGESFAIESAILAETRHINVYRPTVYGEKLDEPLPVLYMPDGGLSEDFLHVAGLIQVLVSNGGMRPFLLVGIENTQRRRDMTGPTRSDEDRKIAPIVGGSGAFRRFVREELMPTVAARYRTTGENAIVGESLAGLFVIETLFLEPDLFSTYIAIDPSLWWDKEALLDAADARLAAWQAGRKTVFVASSNEAALARLSSRLAAIVDGRRPAELAFQHVPLPAETHATIYHPAALLAFRSVFAPPAWK